MQFWSWGYHLSPWCISLFILIQNTFICKLYLNNISKLIIFLCDRDQVWGVMLNLQQKNINLIVFICLLVWRKWQNVKSLWLGSFIKAVSTTEGESFPSVPPMCSQLIWICELQAVLKPRRYALSPVNQNTDFLLIQNGSNQFRFNWVFMLELVKNPIQSPPQAQSTNAHQNTIIYE